jgi:hypothetical protein
MEPERLKFGESSLAKTVRGWSIFLAGVAFGCVLPVAIAFISGPRTQSVSEDPLTGRRLQTSTWLGMKLSRQIQENEVSQWADANSISGIYPARFGWSLVTSESKGWFSPTTIACGGYGIPEQIHRGAIAIDGLTREEVLRKYQSELVAYYKEHDSTGRLQQQWRDLAR